MLHRKIACIAGICLLFFTGSATAQTNIASEDLQKMQIIEDTLLVYADSMYNAYLSELRTEYCEKFVKHLITALKTPNSYSYPFTKLQERINIISEENKDFRIFNWNIPLSEMVSRYYGAVQLPGEKLRLYGLVDHSPEINAGLEDSIFTDGRWYGAIYYRIKTVEVGGKKVYTMFGINSSGPLSTKKVLDPMTITPRGVVFGAPIFNVRVDGRGGRVNRFVLEYKKGVQIQLNWNEDEKMIIYDKLVSTVNDPNRKYTFVPSGEYDGLRWGNGMWNYVPQTMPAINLGDGKAPSDKDPIK